MCRDGPRTTLSGSRLSFATAALFRCRRSSASRSAERTRASVERRSRGRNLRLAASSTLVSYARNPRLCRAHDRAAKSDAAPPARCYYLDCVAEPETVSPDRPRPGKRAQLALRVSPRGRYALADVDLQQGERGCGLDKDDEVGNREARVGAEEQRLEGGQGGEVSNVSVTTMSPCSSRLFRLGDSDDSRTRGRGSSPGCGGPRRTLSSVLLSEVTSAQTGARTRDPGDGCSTARARYPRGWQRSSRKP